MIKWETLSELNNKEFVIEHSLDGRSFQRLAAIEGQSTTYTEQAYQYIHDTPQKGWNYYRLKNIDIAGNFKYSPIRFAYIEPANYNLYPNPAKENLFINYDASLWCGIYDAFGRLINRQLLVPVNGVALISVSQLVAGNYIIKTDGTNRIWHFTKVKE